MDQLRRSQRVPKIRQVATQQLEQVTPRKKRSQRSFVCQRCQSTQVYPKRKSKRTLDKRKLLAVDNQTTHKQVKLCESCATVSAKKAERSRKKSVCEEEKQKYLANGRLFALSLVQMFSDQDLERLYCPQYKGAQPCACIQRFVIGTDNDSNNLHMRAKRLLALTKRAKLLSQLKFCHSVDGKVEKIGLGNGQKKSKEFEEFVLAERSVLRGEVRLCERATQMVLRYSNNFLHKKLKTEPGFRRRISRQKGKAATGQLKELSTLVNENCCSNRCVNLVNTLPFLVQKWRERATSGQAEARKVLAEMLTPTQTNRNNCYRFISLVTGSSHRTISSINQKLQSSGGRAEFEDHGLKKYWQETLKKHHFNRSESSAILFASAARPSNVIARGTAAGINVILTDKRSEQRSDPVIQDNSIALISVQTADNSADKSNCWPSPVHAPISVVPLQVFQTF